MKIEENDFILETSNDSGNFWDLSLKKKVNKGKDNEREEWDKPKYGLLLSTAIKYISHYRTVNKLGDSTTLKNYLKVYLSEIKKLEELVKDND